MDEDLSIPPVRNYKFHNRYYDIKNYFYLTNNEIIENNDKIYKLQPLMEKLNIKFLQQWVFHKDLSINETRGKIFCVSSEQFSQGKKSVPVTKSGWDVTRLLLVGRAKQKNPSTIGKWIYFDITARTLLITLGRIALENALSQAERKF